MKEIGQLLKEKRESLNISLEEISTATKISVKHLQAIEEGDEGKLPGKTFIRGFVYSYAKYLNIDLREIMDKFHTVMGPTNAQTKLPVPNTNNMEKKVSGSGKNIIAGFVIVLIVIGIYFLDRFLTKREAEMQKSDANIITGNDVPVVMTPSTSPTPGTSEAVLGLSPTPTMSDSSSSPTPGIQAAEPLKSSPSPTATAKPTVTPKPTPTPKPTATPKPSPSATVTPVSTPTPKPSPKPSPSATLTPKPTSSPKPTPTSTETSSAGPQEIIVEALDNVTLSVTIDNKPQQDVKMNAEQIQTFKAKGKIKLTTSNGGAISIIHNGFEIGVPGNLGQPKTVTFPP